MALLTIRRDRGYADKMREYQVWLDGIEVGQIREHDELRLEIPSGSHVLVARIDWCGSRPLRFEVGSADSVVLVRSALRSWRVALGTLYILLNRNGYLKLELVG
jgi:hypothetical protein